MRKSKSRPLDMEIGEDIEYLSILMKAAMHKPGCFLSAYEVRLLVRLVHLCCKPCFHECLM